MSFWDSVLSAGTTLLGGVIGGIGGSNSNDAKQTTTTEPWGPQQPYLLGGFQDAAKIYNKLKKTPYYKGETYAGLNNLQKNAIAGIKQFANNDGERVAMNMLDTGNRSLQRGADGQLDVAGDLARFDAGNGTNFNRLINYDPGYATNFSRLTNFSPDNATQQNIYDASMYANNPYLSGQIDAVSQDVRRNLTEDVLPSINRSASSTGMTNSSRAGVAEGIALRGAQDRIGNIAATMRGDAYNQGLNLAEGARTANLGMQLTGLSQGLSNREQARQFNSATRLDALSQGLANKENARQFNTNAELDAMTNAGKMYGDAYGQGLQSTLAGSQQMYNNLDALSKAGALKQQDKQNRLTDKFNRWQNIQNLGFDRLAQYMSLINGNYGSTQTRQLNNGMPNWLNAVQGGVGGAAAGLGLYNDFRNMFNNNGN